MATTRHTRNGQTRKHTKHSMRQIGRVKHPQRSVTRKY